MPFNQRKCTDTQSTANAIGLTKNGITEKARIGQVPVTRAGYRMASLNHCRTKNCGQLLHEIVSPEFETHQNNLKNKISFYKNRIVDLESLEHKYAAEIKKNQGTIDFLEEQYSTNLDMDCIIDGYMEIAGNDRQKASGICANMSAFLLNAVRSIESNKSYNGDAELNKIRGMFGLPRLTPHTDEPDAEKDGEIK